MAAALEDDAEDLFENAPCGYLSTLPDGTIVKVNQTFLNWTGHRRTDLVGRRTFRTMLAPGGQIFYETHLSPLLTMQGSVREIALELIGADRRRIPVLINAVAKRDADGRPLVTRITLFNATDRRQYERELLRARRAAERSEARVRVLQQVTAALAAVPSVSGIADVVARAAAEGFDAVGTVLWLLDDERQVLVRVPPTDPPDPARDRLPVTVLSPYGQVLRSGEPVVLETRDEAAARFPAVLPAMTEAGQHALVVAPLEPGDRHAGVATFGFGAFPDVAAELPLLRTLARQAGQALDRVRLLEETNERARRADLLARLSRHLDELAGFTPRARGAVALLAEELGGWVCLDLAAAKPVRVDAVAARAPQWYGELGERSEFQPGAPALSRVAAGGAAHVVVPDAYQDPPADARVGPPSWAVLPVSARGRRLGALTVVPAVELPLSRGDLPFLTDIADRIALGLENARLYEQERNNALVLQRSLLEGDLPRDARAQLVTRYRPAVSSLEVGGDWYDAFRIGDDRIGVVVGDVVGRGIQAASAMGQLRSAVRAVAGGDISPARLLQRLDMFVERLPQARMATVAYAEVALETGRVRYACAGHPPPIVVEPAGEPRMLWAGRSAPLGARVGAIHRPEAEVVLPPGSRLLLYTDGLVERRTESIDQGLHRLTEELGHRRRAPVAAMVDGILDAMLGGRPGGSGTAGAAGLASSPLASSLLAPGGTSTAGAAGLASSLLAPGKDDVCVLCLSVGVPASFERSVQADPGSLAPLREDLRTWLGGRRVATADRDAVVLACSEAVGNSVEHGYLGGPEGVVTVRVTLSEQTVELDVADRGLWRPPPPDNQRGRGLMLMRRMMDQVTVECDNGTRVTMRRAIGKEVSA